MKVDLDLLGYSMEEAKNLKEYKFQCTCIHGNSLVEYSLFPYLTEEQFVYTASLIEAAMDEMVKTGDCSLWFDYYTEDGENFSVGFSKIVYINTNITIDFSMADTVIEPTKFKVRALLQNEK